MRLTLVKKRLETKLTTTFFWEPEKKVNYFPGQYFYFTLPKLTYSDPRGSTRQFTLSSSPTERLISNTTSIESGSGFKRTLNELEIGESILGEGPNGTFFLDEAGSHLLLAGGIGITPFRSFIKYVTDKRPTETKLYLLYACSSPEEIIFKKELQYWNKKYSNFQAAFTITQEIKTKEKWSGLTGRIDKTLLLKLTKKWNLQIEKINFWLCGSPGMVESLETSLRGLHINPDNIRFEKLTGY